MFVQIAGSQARPFSGPFHRIAGTALFTFHGPFHGPFHLCDYISDAVKAWTKETKPWIRLKNLCEEGKIQEELKN